MKHVLVKYDNTVCFSNTLLLCILENEEVLKMGTELILNVTKHMFLMSAINFQPTWSTVEKDFFYLVPTMNRQVVYIMQSAKKSPAEDCSNI